MRHNQLQDLARHAHADMLTVLEGVAVGMLIGELVTGIPLSRRIAREERRKSRSFPEVGDLEESIAEWPDDRAAAMLEAWRTQNAGRGRHAMHWAADVDSRRLRRRFP